jgi:cell division protein FtsB
MATNTFWNDSRLSSQRPSARSLAISHSTHPMQDEMIGGRALTNRRNLSLPSWVVFCMIILATCAVCATVTMRTHAEKLTAEQEFQQMNTAVKSIRTDNALLKREVERLQNDPRAVETAARTRMNMVRSNEIVIPLE